MQLLSSEESHTEWSMLGDPTEGALLVLAVKAGIDLEKLARDAPREAELPFDSDTKMMATRHRCADAPHRVFIKGAPEAVLGLRDALGPQACAMTLGLLALQFLLCAALIAAAGYVLCQSADRIAKATRLTGGWKGLALLATVTSLPEMASGISAVTVINAPNLAVGNALPSIADQLAQVMGWSRSFVGTLFRPS